MNPLRTPSGLSLVCLVACATACSGNLDGAGVESAAPDTPADVGSDPAPAGGDPAVPPGPGTPGPTGGVTCNVPSVASAPLRRLTNTEYGNAIQDIFGLESLSDVAKELSKEPENGGFHTSADQLRINSELLYNEYTAAAGQVAQAYAAAEGQWGCTADDAACGADLIARLGKSVYRRPLSAEEVQNYGAVFDRLSTTYTFTDGVQWLVSTLLQSPHFLYRVEHGEPAENGMRKPTQFEMASRLSFLLHKSTPSAELLGKAERGELGTPAQIEAEARAMLLSPLAERTTEFYSQWLDVDKLAKLDRDPTIFAGIPDQLGELFQQESEAFLKSVLAQETPSLNELFTAEYTFANAALAEHYGLSGPTGDTFEKVAAPGRSGILTQGGLVSHDPATRTSIVNRGIRLREALLCGVALVVPENVEIPELDEIDENVSQRERLKQHREDASCAGCHALIDPLGIVFEGFDAVGRSRTVDQKGFEVDTKTDLVGVGDVNGPVETVTDLGQKMAASADVTDCYVRQSFNYFFGRDLDTELDACTAEQVSLRFNESGKDLKELMVAFTQSDAFLYMPAEGDK